MRLLIRHRPKNIRMKRGSSTVFLAMAFVTFAVCIAGSIGISRRLTVMSECQAFGRVWTKAILSEYDKHLLEDYCLMAYWGNEVEVNRKIASYLDYSAAGKLNIKIGKTASDLAGYELGDPANFSKALKKGFTASAAESFFSGISRKVRQPDTETDTDELSAGRSIGNTVVLDTLPSGGIRGTVSGDSLTERARSLRDEEGVRSAAASSGIEAAFIWKYFSSCVTAADDRPHYLNNELEYVIRGSPDDEVNYTACRKRIFLMRNALNLASLYKDSSKVELIAAAAELITPGPLGAATQILIAEAWAAIETEEDLKTLYSNGKVPVIKTSDQWQTDLSSVLDSNKVRKELDEGSRQLLDEKREEISNLPGIDKAAEVLTEGLNYDEHLMIMIMCLNRNIRLLRLMDIVQINMKFRYYRDFNLMEYYTGVRYAITADGRSYAFEDSYR